MSEAAETSYHWPYNAVFCVMKFHADQWSSDPVPFKEATDHSQSSEVNGRLFSAANRGDVKEIEKVLLQGADVNFEHCAGTPLTRAARRGHLECVEVLLDRGADVNLTGKFNCQTCTALHAAASNGHYSVAKLLLDHGANVNAIRDQDSTPLHDAAKFGHPDIAELLLQRGAEKNLRTSRGKTALYLAVSEGKLDGLRWVLEAVIEYYHYQGFCYNGDFFPSDAIEYLFSNEKQVKSLDMSDLETLRKALLRNDLEAMKLILEERPAGPVKERHLQLVKLLLDSGIDPEIQDQYETGPLEEAIINNDDSCIQLLIQYGINVNRLGSVFGSKGAPLHSTCLRAGETILKLLLENGADPNSRDPRGQSPLHIAVYEKNSECVRLLLEHGACVDVVAEDGKTPLHEVKTLACAMLLVEHGADVKAMTKSGQSVLFSAADRTGEGSCIRYLIEQGADPLVQDEKGMSALDLTIERHECTYSYDVRENDDGGVECAKILLEYGAKADTSNMSLHTAVSHRRPGLLTVLLHSEVDVDSLYVDKRTALFKAVECNFILAAQMLIEKGADPNLKCNNRSPLHAALMKGYEGSAKVLIEAGAFIEKEIFNFSKALEKYTDVLKQLSDVNRQDEDGVALIHLLCWRGQPAKVLNTLFEAGVNANIADKHGVTPLHLVSFNGCKPFVEQLLMNKVDVNLRDENGRTPLHYAAFKGYSRVAQLLLDHGADPNVQDTQHQTPVHFAVDHLADDICVGFLKIILSHGAHPNVTDVVGRTALDKAQTNGLAESVKLLEVESVTAKPREFVKSTMPDLSLYTNMTQYVSSPDLDSSNEDSDDDMGFGLFD